ncbi:MAG: 50S ribosome-binding GTPase [Candidatus Brocadiae bacterium]|nr:50S ribosome-binding GTPase [Candidatus Brocadiia bacterium]
MPANLTPQYLEAEQRYRSAKTPQEKLEALELMLREIPKHKGTDKLQAELKRKISDQRKSSSEKSSKKTVSYSVDSHGNQQVVVIGPPNSGKSKLVSQLTGTEMKVADYPFTTRMPQPAMMKYEDIVIQIVDTPAISEEHCDPWMGSIVRSANAILLVADLTDDSIVKNLGFIFEFLEKQKIYLIEVNQEINLAEDKRTDMDTFQNTLLVGNKKDVDVSEIVLELLQDEYKTAWHTFPVSSSTGENLEALKHKIFETLDIIRIIPKPPGKKPDFSSPIILRKGSSVWDLADSIHHDLAQNLKSAKIWNCKDYLDGQRIPIDYILSDRHIVELEA